LSKNAGRRSVLDQAPTRQEENGRVFSGDLLSPCALQLPDKRSNCQCASTIDRKRIKPRAQAYVFNVFGWLAEAVRN
jgi:hypothetical protein